MGALLFFQRGGRALKIRRHVAKKGPYETRGREACTATRPQTPIAAPSPAGFLHLGPMYGTRCSTLARGVPASGAHMDGYILV